MDTVAIARGGGRPEDFSVERLGLLRFDVETDEGRHVPLYLQAVPSPLPNQHVEFRCIYNDSTLQRAGHWLPDCTYDSSFSPDSLPFGRRAASSPVRSGIVPIAIRRYYFETNSSGANDAAADNAPIGNLSWEEQSRYSARLVRDVLDVMSQYPDADIEVAVVGFADTSGHSPQNLSLSERRAVAVRDLLIQGGVPSTVITVQGGGELEATRDCTRLARSERATCLREARRVEVRVWRSGD